MRESEEPMMKVILSSGDEVEIIGPVIKDTVDGLFISHRAFNAEINGEVGTISMDELEGAKFPDDVVEQMEKAFDDSLAQVKLTWSRLKNFGA
jgi:hypothetical protein